MVRSASSLNPQSLVKIKTGTSDIVIETYRNRGHASVPGTLTRSVSDVSQQRRGYYLQRTDAERELITRALKRKSMR